jgi:dTDP-4-amino-4,6-dideoxygalactose transaminase
MIIPLLNLRREYEYLQEEIDIAVQRCFTHQHWIRGPEVEQFEEAVKQYLGSAHCIGVSSGTDALVLGLRALAIHRTEKEYFDKRDGILVPSLTFSATGDAILRAGATPVFVDVDPRTYTINRSTVLRAIESNKEYNIVGMIPVHLYGQSCDMDALMDIAKERNLFILEDVAQAFGATWREKKLGTIGDIGAYSFFPSKNLGGYGDGGMVVTEHQELASIIRMLAAHGGMDKYNPVHIGYNARLDALQAAILGVKLLYIDDFNARRQRIAARYDAGISALGYTPPFIMEHAIHVYHQYTMSIDDGMRDTVAAFLKERGVSTGTYYAKGLHEAPLFSTQGSKQGGLATTEDISRRVLNLPIGPLQTEEETRAVLAALHDVA